MKKLTTEEFISRAIKVHGNEFDYSYVVYHDMFIKVKIHCKKHDVWFEQSPMVHLKGCGCLQCKSDKCSVGSKGNNNSRGARFSTDDLIKKSKLIYGDDYDYSHTKYIRAGIKSEFTCKRHNILFRQTPSNHYLAKGCPDCIKEIVGRDKNSTEEFLKNAKNKHGNKFDYSMVVYKGCRIKVKIICNKHKSVFEQTPASHLQHGCPICKESKGEKQIADLLESRNINFIRDHKFNACKNKHRLRFDFYIPNLNTCIEFDGIQHSVPIKYFGGNDRLELTKYRDSIKNFYCKSNNIPLLRISYKDDIRDTLFAFLGDIYKKNLQV